jgi:hypothetical protein
MANMSYCRFSNTLEDLKDCLEHINDNVTELTTQEFLARLELIQVCIGIIKEVGDEVDQK